MGGASGALVSNWGHYDVSNNCGSAVNCQNMRKNCLFASVFFAFGFRCNVVNCKPARPPLGGHQEVRTIEVSSP